MQLHSHPTPPPIYQPQILIVYIHRGCLQLDSTAFMWQFENNNVSACIKDSARGKLCQSDKQYTSQTYGVWNNSLCLVKQFVRHKNVLVNVSCDMFSPYMELLMTLAVAACAYNLCQEYYSALIVINHLPVMCLAQTFLYLQQKGGDLSLKPQLVLWPPVFACGILYCGQIIVLISC